MPFTLVQIVPTGVGAAIGGFAGDAGPATRVLAAACDVLVTHPNVVNAAPLFGLPANGLYVEGHAMDGWLAGRWALRPGQRQRIGLLLDAAVERQPLGTLEANLNAANAVRAVHGVELVGYRLTEAPLGCRVGVDERGLSSGGLRRADALIEGARALLRDGATAIAVMADLGELDPAEELRYREQGGVDPIGALEAVLSHLIVAELGVPAAHAPLLPFDPLPPALVDPRAAAEYVGHTYLPCILQGLARHPALVPAAMAGPGDLARADAVVVPAGCLGGPGVLAALDRGIPVIAVEENTTAVSVTAADLGVPVLPARTYLEAAGIALALRAGVDPRACTRPLPALARLDRRPSGLNSSSSAP